MFINPRLFSRFEVHSLGASVCRRVHILMCTCMCVCNLLPVFVFLWMEESDKCTLSVSTVESQLYFVFKAGCRKKKRLCVHVINEFAEI